MIYVSGKITGKPDYKNDFARGVLKAQQLNHGQALNPALVNIDGGSWEDYMKADLHLLLLCDAVFMLRGWKHSRGARLEHLLAKNLGITIYYEEKLK